MADSTAVDETENETQLTFTVKSSAESKYTLTLPTSTTIASVKDTLSTSDHANIPPDRQRLIYSGRVLKDTDTLESCKIKEGNTVHLVKGAASNSRQNPTSTPDSTSTGTSGDTSATAATSAASNVPTNIASGPGASNPLAQLTGARYAGFHGLPGMDAFGADGGMGAPPSPDAMLRLLEDPNFASQMNEAMNNPAVVDMLRNNPMIRNNPVARQALENPEFRRMMMDPQVIRMQMQMQRAMGGGGMGGMGGAGGEGAFPMPGATDTTESRGAEAAAGAGNGTGAQSGGAPAAAGNPFAALFGGGAGAAGQPGSPNANQNNPMAAMTQQLMQNPEMMRSMMQMMGGGAGAGNPTGDSTAADGNNAANPFGAFNPFAFGDFGAGAAGLGQGQTASQPADTRPPEERYESQLAQLNDMGFYEFDRNVTALRRCGGSVQGAIEWLLSNP